MSVPEAIALVEVATKATTAYHRPDLTARLGRTTERLQTRAVRVLVVGEFKQGKSQLVNALVSAPVCPVDDDVATSVLTVVRHADTPSVALVRVGDGNGDARSAPRSPLERARGRTCRKRGTRATGPACATPRSASRALAGRRPGARRHPRRRRPGLGARRRDDGRARLRGRGVSSPTPRRSTPRPSWTSSRQAVRLCPNVACVLTKTDLYPHWRRIAELDRGHLRPPASRRADRGVVGRCAWQAVRTGTQALNEESGFPALIRYLRERGAGPGGPAGPPLDRARRHAVTEQLRHAARPSRRRGDEPRAGRRSSSRELTEAQAAADGAEGAVGALAAHAQRRGRRPQRRHRPRPARPDARDHPEAEEADRRGGDPTQVWEPVRRPGCSSRSPPRPRPTSSGPPSGRAAGRAGRRSTSPRSTRRCCPRCDRAGGAELGAAR